MMLLVWLAEASWFYLAFVALTASSIPGMLFSPVAVLLPYGLAALAGITIDRALVPSILANKQRDKHNSQQVAHGALATLLLMLAQLLEGLVALLLTLWWEMYRGHGLLDAEWLRLIAQDPRGSASVVPPVAWLVALGVFLWWRGLHLSREELDFPSLMARFLWGTFGLLILAAFGATSILDPVESSLYLAFYLLFGLAAMAVARLRAAQRDRLGDVRHGRGWQGVVLAALLLAAGFGGGLLLLPWLGSFASWLWDQVIVPSLWLLLEIARWIAHLLGLDRPPEPVPMAPGEGVANIGRGENPFLELPAWIREVARMLFNLCWIGVGLAGLYSWVSRWRGDRRSSSARGGSRGRLPWRFRLDPMGALMRLLATLARRWPALSRWVRLHQPPRERVSSIRQLYRRLLAWGAENGSPRECWMAPREYQDILSRRWPDLAADLDTLTESYLVARYGGIELDKQQIQAALEGWQRIEMSGQQSGPRTLPLVR